MRRLPVTALCVVLLLSACRGGDDPPTEALAVQAERVADLLDQGEDCRALEATATLQTMADDPAVADDVHAATATWADRARQQLSCDVASEPPPAGPGDPPDDDRDAPARDEGSDGDGDGPDGDTGPPEVPPGQRDDEDPGTPGRGNGRGG